MLAVVHACEDAGPVVQLPQAAPHFFDLGHQAAVVGRHFGRSTHGLEGEIGLGGDYHCGDSDVCFGADYGAVRRGVSTDRVAVELDPRVVLILDASAEMAGLT